MLVDTSGRFESLSASGWPFRSGGFRLENRRRCDGSRKIPNLRAPGRRPDRYSESSTQSYFTDLNFSCALITICSQALG